MRRLLLLFRLVVLFAPLPALAQVPPEPRLYAEVAMLHLDSQPHPDIEALLRSHWGNYFQAQGDPADFTLAQVRVGRFDLDGDGDPELFLMIDQPHWVTTGGKPLVVATWVDGHWLPVGWGWADEDGVFVTDEVLDGWRSIVAGNTLMQWTAKGYRGAPLPPPGLTTTP